MIKKKEHINNSPVVIIRMAGPDEPTTTNNESVALQHGKTCASRQLS